MGSYTHTTGTGAHVKHQAHAMREHLLLLLLFIKTKNKKVLVPNPYKRPSLSPTSRTIIGTSFLPIPISLHTIHLKPQNPSSPSTSPPRSHISLEHQTRSAPHQRLSSMHWICIWPKIKNLEFFFSFLHLLFFLFVFFFFLLFFFADAFLSFLPSHSLEWGGGRKGRRGRGRGRRREGKRTWKLKEEGWSLGSKGGSWHPCLNKAYNYYYRFHFVTKMLATIHSKPFLSPLPSFLPSFPPDKKKLEKIQIRTSKSSSWVGFVFSLRLSTTAFSNAADFAAGAISLSLLFLFSVCKSGGGGDGRWLVIELS